MSKVYIKKNYGQIPNRLLNDSEISLKAKGMFGFIQSKYDGWEFSAERIAYQCKEGVSSIRSTLKELESAGYLMRHKWQDQKGHWQIDYILQENPEEIPTIKNPTSESQQLETESQGNPKSENHTNNSKKDNSKKDKEIKNSNRLSLDEAGKYNYDYSYDYNGWEGVSNVKIPEQYRDENIMKLINSYDKDEIPNKHFVNLLKREYAFNLFWEKYDKKVERKKTKDKFMSLSLDDIKVIVDTVEDYVKANSDKKYRKMPTTYLNGRCWEDEIDLNTSSTNKMQKAENITYKEWMERERVKYEKIDQNK